MPRPSLPVGHGQIVRPRGPRHRPAILLVVLAALTAVALTGVALVLAPRPAVAAANVASSARLGGTAASAPAVAAGRTPNVIGSAVADAGAQLIAAGYRSPVSWRADPAAVGAPCSVVGQDPVPGTLVTADARATLRIVRGSCR